MQISCERCATVYELDDNLLPSGGAPVQCTRCGHVFTARPVAPPAARMPTPHPGAPACSTQFFGHRNEVARPPAEARSTHVFGGSGALAEPPARAASPSSTQFFGHSASGPSEPAPPQQPSPSVSTPRAPVVVFAKAEEQPRAAPAPAQPAAAQAEPVATAGSGRFGTPAPGQLKAFAAAGHEARAAALPAAGEPSPSATVRFGQGAFAPAAPAPVPAAPAPVAAVEDAGRTVTPARAQPGAPEAAAARPTRKAPGTGASRPAGPPASAPAAKRSGDALRRPAPEAAARSTPKLAATAKPSATTAGPAVAPKTKSPAVDATDFEQQLLRRRRRVPYVVGGVFAAILVIVAVVALLKRTHVPTLDPAISAADQAALRLLERDDTESLKKAVAAWEALEAKAPEYVPAKANQLIAQVLLTQDLRDEIRRLESRRNAAEKEMVKLQSQKAPEDWEARAEARRQEIIELKKQFDPLVDDASKRDERAGALLKASKALVEKQHLEGEAVLRASSIYYAAKMSENAQRLAEAYRKSGDPRKALHDDARAFADLAQAMFNAQPRLSAEMHDQGLAAAAAARQKNPNLLRTWMLEAKIRLAAKEFALARKAIAELRAANPSHATAVKLVADIDQAEAAAAKEVAEGAEQPK